MMAVSSMLYDMDFSLSEYGVICTEFVIMDRLRQSLRR